MVIIHDEGLPRGLWKLGKIEEVISGRDGKVRGAILRLASGSGMLRQPIQLLYPLEVHDNTEPSITIRNSAADTSSVVNDHSVDTTPSLTNDSHTCNTRSSKRKAAFQARDRLMATALTESEDC